MAEEAKKARKTAMRSYVVLEVQKAGDTLNHVTVQAGLKGTAAALKWIAKNGDPKKEYRAAAFTSPVVRPTVQTKEIRGLAGL